MLHYLFVLLGLSLGSYYDINNNRIIPEWLSYSFIVLSFVLSVYIYGFNISLYFIPVGILFLGYLMYRLGYIGGADILYVSGISLLFQFDIFNVPAFVLILFFSMFLMSIYMLVGFLLRASKSQITISTLDVMKAVVWMILYSFMAYVLITNIGMVYIGYFTFITGLLASLFTLFRNNIMEGMIKWISLDEVIEEDILAVEKVPDLVKKYKLGRLLTRERITFLREKGIDKIPVFTGLPPYLPFLLMGVLVLIAII